MAVNIGPKIGVDGEAEFRKEINNINQQLKTLGSEMAKVTTEFLDNEDSQESLTAQAAVLNKQLDSQKKKLELLQKGLRQSADKYGENDTRTLKWAQAVNEATAELNRMNRRLDAAEKGLDGMGDEAAETAKDVDNLDGAMGRIGSVGGTVKNVAVGVGAGIAAIGAAAVAGIAALNGLADATSDYRVEQGRLLTAFEESGFGVETAKKSYTELYAILGDSGQATEAAQLLSQLADNAQQVDAWLTIAAGSAGKFGTSLPIESLIEDALQTAANAEVTGTLVDVLERAGYTQEEYNARLAECGDESERTAFITDTLNEYFSESAEIYRENNEQLLETNRNQAALNDTMALVGGAFDNLKNKVLSDYIPSIQQAGSETAAFFDNLTAIYEQGGLSAVGDYFLNLGAEIVSGVENSAEDIGKSGVDIVTWLLNGITDGFPFIFESGVSIISNFANGLAAGVPGLIHASVDATKNIAETITNPESMGQMIDAGLNLILSLGEGIVDALPELLETPPVVVENLAEGVVENAPKILSAGGKLILSLAEGLIKAAPDLIFAGPKLTKSIIDGILNGIPDIKDIGKDIVRGLWDGITSMGDWLGDRVSDFFGGILDNAKDFLGINSPSKVFADEVGVYMAQGVGVGFERGMQSVNRQIKQGMQPPEISFGNYAAGMVNGLQTALSGYGGGSYRIEIPFIINGQEFSRAIVPDLRSVMRANPEVT